ncbi:MAG: peptide ABC transporter substrate-binding protein [Patescibacteria group bacterium]
MSVKKNRRIPTIGQLWHLPRLLSKTERRVASGAIFIAVLATFVLGYRFLTAHQDVVPASGGTYTEGLAGTPYRINPIYSSASDVDNDIAHLVYSGLMRFDPVDGLVPDLATSFAMAPDGKSYTFILRDNVKFHNGDALTSADVAFTIRAIQNPEYHSPIAGAFDGVTIDTPDARTITFALANPSSPFLSSLTVGVLPSQVWSNIPASAAGLAELNLKPIGSGPFRFEKLTKDNLGTLRSITLTKNKNFYRGVPYLDTLQLKFYSSTDELPNLLRNKNIEGAVTVPFTEASKLADDHSLSVLRPSIPEYTAAFFNLKSTGAVADQNVRKALDQSLDRQKLLDATGGHGAPITSLLLPGMTGAPSSVPGPDIAGAVASLETSGYKLTDGNAVRIKGDKPLAIAISYTETAELTLAANELKRQWELLGASVNLLGMSSDELQTNALRNRNFDVLLASELYGAFPDPYPYWHSSQATSPGLNVTGFANRTADDAMNIIRTNPNEVKRNEAFLALSKLLTDGHVAAFLYQPSYVYVTTSEMKGVDISRINLPADRFSNINLWYKKTKAVFKR